MKAVHFSTTDHGGAYRAAERISACMKSAGIDSCVVVRTKTRQDTDCVEYFKDPVSAFFSKAKNFLNLLLSPGKLTTDLFGTDISGSSYVREADVVVLHWVNSFVSYRGVRRLVKTGKKIIWVMHDEWVYTEGFHLAYERENSKSFPVRLLGRMNLKLKRRSFAGSGITYVAVSSWLKEQATASEILKGERVAVINDPLDTDLFRPLTDVTDPYDTGNKKVILFGADKATYNPNKGFNYLAEVLKRLDGEEYCAICFGNSPKESRIALENMDIIYTGTINNDDDLVNLYNLADVMVTPSLQEAFGYTCLEALACGTPVACFDTSGLRDQIVHKENGYLARISDPEDLYEGIMYCLEHKEEMAGRAREKAVSISGYDITGQKYRDVLM